MAPPHPPKPTSGPTMSNRAPSAVPARHGNGEALAPKPPAASQLVEPPAVVNRKKQKRRQKQAARMASEQRTHNGCTCGRTIDHTVSNSAHPDMDETPSHEDHAYDSADAYYDENESLDAPHSLPSVSGDHEEHNAAARRAKKKKGRKGRADSQTIPDGSSTSLSTHSTSMTHPLPPPLPPHVAPRDILKSAKDRSIWNTSTQEERENIKAFWLELGEDERRQLVKVEKDAVLKKMKEQQKHSCSCTVCGRKRTAIEEELEVLYDAYYEELEQYANTNQDSFDPDAPIVPPPRLYQPPLRPSGQHARPPGQFHPSRGQVQELPEDHGLDEEEEEEEEEDDEEEDDDDESYSDEEFVDDDTHAPRTDFFAFGNSLTVKDGILTVADDLLKNDGKHFIDMMEQLAERRMQREEDTRYGIAAAHQSWHDGHNHGPLDEDDYDEEEEEEEEEDEDYDSQEEEDYEEDEMDAMTEEQRMEEGRRMFQIFAARMFEQRVLTAYREKVAEQRQQKLIEELMEEQTRNEQRSAKKAREAQKKKDKKRLQRQAKDEEKARREAEKAAEEAAVKAEQEKKLEEQRKKRDEQRKKREAERKAQEDERARKEAEKQRRLREDKERQEAERKQREQKEQQEKEKREEARRKEREEREAREKKAREERERKTQEEQARKDKEAKSGVKRRAQGKRTSQSGPAPIPPTVQKENASTHFTSPHHQIATPVVPKASTPAKHRQPSHQGSHTSSPMSQPTSGEQLSISPRSMPLSQSSAASSATSRQGQGQQQPVLHHPQPSTPLSPLGSNRSHPPGFAGLTGLPTHPPTMPGMAPRPPVAHELPVYPPQSGPPMGQFRGVPTSSGIPPGFSGARMPPARAFPFESGQGLPLHAQQPIPNTFPAPQSGIPQTHSRQASGGIEQSPFDAFAHPFPVSRPRPITRPSSTAPQDQNKFNHQNAQQDVDDLSAQLGSSALLDDAEPPAKSNLSQSLPGATAPGSLPHPSRASFSASSFLTSPMGAPKPTNLPPGPGMKSSSPWSSQPFGGFPGAPTWEVPPGSGWSNITLGGGGLNRMHPHTSRPVEVRLHVIQACNQLSNGARDFSDMEHIVRRVNQVRPQWEHPISAEEVQDICDTEGNSQNGGGSFTVVDKESRKFVKFEPSNNTHSTYNPTPGRRGSSNPGEIGSPVPGVPGAAAAVGTSIGGSSSFHRQFASPPTGF